MDNSVRVLVDNLIGSLLVQFIELFLSRAAVAESQIAQWVCGAWPRFIYDVVAHQSRHVAKAFGDMAPHGCVTLLQPNAAWPFAVIQEVVVCPNEADIEGLVSGEANL